MVDLLGMITNPIGTLLGPTGLGMGSGGSAIAPGGILAPGSEMGMIASAKMAQDTARETNSFNASEAQKARDFSGIQSDISRNYNSAEAAANRNFQADQVLNAQTYNTAMSNSAYQRTVKDMKAAGINPMLAYMQGGASTPLSASASGSQASTSAPGSSTASGQQNAMGELFQKGLQNSITSAQEQRRLNKDMIEQEQDIQRKKEAIHTQEEETKRIRQETRGRLAETKIREKELQLGKLGGIVPDSVKNWFQNWYDSRRKNKGFNPDYN